MARTKKIKEAVISSSQIEQASEDLAIELTAAFDDYTIDKYGTLNPPAPYITPTNIRPLDALLGGGIVSSSLVTFSSTPETGKSSIAFQFAKQFLNYHPNGIVVYFDIESNAASIDSDSITVYQESRIETFELKNNPRFRYNRRPYNIKDFFEFLEGLIEKKREMQQKTGKELKILFILDSMTALDYSRIEAVEEFDKIPGKRAQELSFHLNKCKLSFAYDRITMITIDQLKAAMNLKSQYEKADEKTVGVWRNTKAATGVYTFQHMVSQWLFFSKGKEIDPVKYPGWGIDGWIINIITEKNKNVASKHEISLIFDKRNGIDKFWTEFIFLSDYSPSEAKLIKGGINPFFPLSIKTEGAYSKLEVIDPKTGEIEYTSKSFYKKNAKNLYETDEEFHKWFDKAVDVACYQRISLGLLKIQEYIQDDNNNEQNYLDDNEEENIMKNNEEKKIKKTRKNSKKILDQEKTQIQMGALIHDDENYIYAESQNDEFNSQNQILYE